MIVDHDSCRSTWSQHPSKLTKQRASIRKVVQYSRRVNVIDTSSRERQLGRTRVELDELTDSLMETKPFARFRDRRGRDVYSDQPRRSRRGRKSH